MGVAYLGLLLLGVSQAAIKVLTEDEVLSKGSAGERSASKVTSVVVGSIQFLEGCWTEGIQFLSGC